MAFPSTALVCLSPALPSPPALLSHGYAEAHVRLERHKHAAESMLANNPMCHTACMNSIIKCCPNEKLTRKLQPLVVLVLGNLKIAKATMPRGV